MVRNEQIHLAHRALWQIIYVYVTGVNKILFTGSKSSKLVRQTALAQARISKHGSGLNMPTFKLELQDQQKEFKITRQGSAFHVEWDGRSVECVVRFFEDSHFVLELLRPDGSRRQLHAAGSTNGDNRQIWVDGQTISYRRIRGQRGEANHEGLLAATIPAIVTEVLVAPGNLVTVGTKLILLESMKMIIPIQAPYDGIVAAVHCQKGEAVQAGVQLIELTKKGKE